MSKPPPGGGGVYLVQLCFRNDYAVSMQWKCRPFEDVDDALTSLFSTENSEDDEWIEDCRLHELDEEGRGALEQILREGNAAWMWEWRRWNNGDYFKLIDREEADLSDPDAMAEFVLGLNENDSVDMDDYIHRSADDRRHEARGIPHP